MEQMDIDDEVDVSRGIPESSILHDLHLSYQIVHYKIIHFGSASDRVTMEEFIRNLNPTQFPRLFMIIIELFLDDDSLKRIESHCSTKFTDRPFLIENANKIYAKCNAASNFVYVSNNKFETLQDFLLEIKKPNFEMNFEMFYSAMYNGVFGAYEGSILKQKLSTNALIDDKSLKELALNSGDALVMRFLELFNTGMSYDDKLNEVLKVIKDGNFEAFLSAIDAPFIRDYIPYNQHFNQLLLHKNSQGESILGMVVLEGSAPSMEIFNFLIKYCSTTLSRMKEMLKIMNFCAQNSYLISPQETVGESSIELVNYMEVMKILLEIDFLFPPSYVLNLSTIESDFHCNLHMERDEFHSNIRNNEKEKVTEFITKHPKTKRAYDVNNNSALQTAFETNIPMYVYLRTQGFSYRESENLHQKIKGDKKKSAEVYMENKKYNLKRTDEHILTLVQRSSFHYNCYDISHDEIFKLFIKINEINEVKSMLQFVAASKEVHFTFDLKNLNADHVDPTLPDNVRGVVHPNHHIIIAADESKEHRLGTLAHEITHYVMLMVFENYYKPYFAHDEEGKNEYLKIVDEYRIKYQEMDQIIQWVFGPSYNKSKHEAELIVRPAHMMAFYSRLAKNLSSAKKKSKKIFKYFTETLKIMKTVNIEERQQVRLVNNLMNVLPIITPKKATSWPFRFDEDHIKNSMIDIKNSNYIIESNVPLLTLTKLSDQFFEERSNIFDAEYIFASSEQFHIDEIYGKLMAVVKNQENKVVIVDCSQKLDETVVKEIANLTKEAKMKKNFVSIVIRSGKGAALSSNPIFRCFTLLKLKHAFGDLSQESQTQILETRVNFQGNTLKLKDISSTSIGDFMCSELLDKLCLKQPIFINTRAILDEKFFFIPRYYKRNSQNIELIQYIKQNQNEKVVLVSDLAGTGKSWSFKKAAVHLQNTKRDHWASYIDLKSYTKDLEGDVVNFAEDFARIFLENAIDRCLLNHKHKENKAIILFDGFDEVSPNYKAFMMNFFTLFLHDRSRNQMWVSTRPHLKEDLATKLNRSAFTLVSLTTPQQIDYLQMYWTPEGATEDKKLIVRDFPSKIVNKMQEVVRDLVGFPLIVNMLAKIYKEEVLSDKSVDELLRDFNILNVYKKFIEKFNDSWALDKGPIAHKALVKSSIISMNFLQTHQFHALKFYFNDLINVFGMRHDANEWPDIEIVRIGLINNITSGKAEFIHETIIQYFIVDFILDCLKKPAEWKCEEDFVKILRTLLSDGIPDVKFKIARTFIEKSMIEIESEFKRVMEEYSGNEELTKILKICKEENCHEIEQAIKGIVELRIAKRKLEELSIGNAKRSTEDI